MLNSPIKITGINEKVSLSVKTVGIVQADIQAIWKIVYLSYDRENEINQNTQ